ncbi:MAG: hypothetical protein LBE83_05855, partial [Propionibacteriaceae bacterium]|nr:hypothetical protein [Propionibacteriaceae bacterium]
MRVAVVDCGTNTVRLLIAEGDAGGGLVELARDLRFARLGEGVDASGRFRADALARLFTALDDFAVTIADFGVDKVRFVATSAARDAANAAEMFDGVRVRLGVDPEIISGIEEAELSFLGALIGGPLAVGGDILVVDIGGGSTELIRGSASSAGCAVSYARQQAGGDSPNWPHNDQGGSVGVITAAISLDVGSVRLLERFLHHDPPLEGEIAAARRFTGDLLD